MRKNDELRTELGRLIETEAALLDLRDNVERRRQAHEDATKELERARGVLREANVQASTSDEDPLEALKARRAQLQRDAMNKSVRFFHIVIVRSSERFSMSLRDIVLIEFCHLNFLSLKWEENFIGWDTIGKFSSRIVSRVNNIRVWNRQVRRMCAAHKQTRAPHTHSQKWNRLPWDLNQGCGSWKWWKRSFFCGSAKLLPLPLPHRLFDLKSNLVKKFCSFPNVD